MYIPFVEGDRVYVSGDVYYGSAWHRVDCGGTIVDVRLKSCLVNLDSIDGDGHAVCIVKKKYIREARDE